MLPDNMSLIIFSIQSLKAQYIIMYMICTRVSSTTACIHIQYCILFIYTHMYDVYIRQSIIYILVKMQNLREREGDMTRQDM